jgi:hypothetical protein
MTAPKRRWSLTYEVSPDPENPAFGESGSKLVNCWIDAESLANAAEIAARDLDSWHWSIIKLVEAKPASLQAAPQASMDQIEREDVESKVYCFDD